MNQPWSDLPNAHHIDWVVESVKNNPDLWAAAWEAARGAARDAVWDAARDAVWDAVWDAVHHAVHDVPDGARGRIWKAAWNTAWHAASDSALALVAYDDCDEYLKMSYEELRIWAALSGNPAAVFLRPMVYVREKIHESELVS